MLEVGIKLTIEKTVTENDTASRAASGTVDVLATPVMIAWMEKAALELVQARLEEGESTVGTEVNIKHLKSSPVGKKLSVSATLKEIDRRKLTFYVSVADGEEIVGEGTHTRFIINKEKFALKNKN